MTKNEAFKILGIPASSSEEEIKTAYRKLSMKHHPDREGGDEEKFKNIKEAYERASSKEPDTADWSSFRRQTTDDTLNDIFANLFKKNDFFSAGGHAPNAGVSTATIDINESDAFFGAKKHVKLRESTFFIDIPAGMNAVSDYIIHKMPNGDQCMLNVRIKSNFDIDWAPGSLGNTKTDLYISPFRMILGGWVDVQMIDGTSVSVRVPPGLESNKLLKVKGRGYWRNQQCASRGDCMLRVIPLIKKLDDYDHSELVEFSNAINEKYNPPDGQPGS